MTRNSLRPLVGRSFPYLCLALLLIAAAFLINPPRKAQAAATFTVNDLGDTDAVNPAVSCLDSSGNCTLRGAIEAANVVPGDYTINFDPALTSGGAATIILVSGELSISSNITINGPGANLLTVSGNQASRVFHIDFGSTVTLDSLTIANGKVSDHDFSQGGGIFNGGNLTITNSTLSGNSVSGVNANAGGGIANRRFLTIINSTLSGNSASGGTGNVGGGIANSGIVTITNSTLSGNSVSGGTVNSGGAIYNSGTVTITNSTLSANSAGAGSTVNIGGGGIFNHFDDGDGIVKTRNTIIAGNASSNGPDVWGPFTSQGYNLIGKSDGSTGFTNGTNNDQVGTSGSPLDPMLGPLKDNGGPTRTHALLAGSPALDAGITFPVPVATSLLAVTPGSRVVTPSVMSQIPGVGNSLYIDSGLASHEVVVITARTATSFTATFTKSHAANFTISLLEHDQRGQPRPYDNPSIPNASGGDGSDIGAFELQNQPPVAGCQDITVNANSSCAATISVADINNGSSDPDAGDTVTLSFDPSSTVTSTTIGLGDHLVTLYVTDSFGAQSSCTATVHVVDKTPPTISGASASPNTIWPPNGKLVDVFVSYSTADNCSAVNSQLSISSNEPTASGDMIVVDNHHVRLRADRLGSGKGRIYTITITATDQSGNSSQKSVTVTVPHDQGK